MKTTQLTVTERLVETIDADLLIYCVAEEKDKAPLCDHFIERPVKKAFDLEDFSGKTEEQLMFYPTSVNTEKAIRAQRVLVMGMGKIKKEKDLSEVCDILRKIGGNMAKVCEKIKAKTITLCLPVIQSLDPEKTAECFAEGILLGDYQFLKYKKTTKRKMIIPDLRGFDSPVQQRLIPFEKEQKRGLPLPGQHVRQGIWPTNPVTDGPPKNLLTMPKPWPKLMD